MKKLICLTLALLIMICLVACGEKAVKEDSSGESVSNSVSSEVKQEITNDDSKLPRKYNVPLTDIYINAPAWQELEKGFTELFIVQGEKFVSITYDTDSFTNLKEVHDNNTDTLMYGLENFCNPNELIIDTDSNEKVNGIDVYRYEGHMNCGLSDTYEAYVIGYDFIMNNTPVSVCGGVINEDQSEELKAEIKETVEAMMSTLRDKE